MISQRPVIFGERETFDGVIAYTLDMEKTFDMENTFDIPRATTPFGTESREAEGVFRPGIEWWYQKVVFLMLGHLDTRPWWVVRLY